MPKCKAIVAKKRLFLAAARERFRVLPRRSTPSPHDSTPSSLPRESTPSALPRESTPSALPRESTPSALPPTLTPSSLPHESKPSALPSDSTASSLPCDSTPTSLPRNSTPSSLPSDSIDSSLPRDSTPSLPRDSTPSSLPPDSTPSALPPASKTSALPPASTPEPSTSASPSLTVPSTLSRSQLTSSRVPKVTEVCDAKYVISAIQLRSLFAEVRCSRRSCKQLLQISTESNRLDTAFSLVCPACEKIYCNAPPTTIKLRGGNYFTEVNLQQVYFSLVNGEGCPGLMRRAAYLSQDPITTSSFIRHCRYLYGQMDDYYPSVMKGAHDAVKDYYTSKDISQPDEVGILDIEVVYDGTWKTRVYKSHIGLGVVKDAHTGIVIDFEVICNKCISCEKCKTEQRKANHKCHKNFEGNSGAMETEAAVRLWGRSMQHKFRYTTFVGDGDSSAFTAVCAMNNGCGPYEDLTSPELLKRRLTKRTKNPNESIHLKLWLKCLKGKPAGYYRVRFLTRVTVLEHNFGYGNCNLLAHLFGTKNHIQYSNNDENSRTKSPQ